MPQNGITINSKSNEAHRKKLEIENEQQNHHLPKP